MTLQNVINMARSGELKNLAVRDDDSTIIDYINLGMLELYKRFPLDVKEYVITLQDGVEIYTMPADYMWLVTAYDEVPEYSSDAVAIIPINEEDNPLSINTISYNQIQIPTTVTGSYISLIYVAAPVVLEYDADGVSEGVAGVRYWDIYEDPAAYTDYVALSAYQVPLPPQMIEPLLQYIGYRGHKAVSGEVNGEHVTHYMNFESSCNRIESRGMISSDDMSMTDRYGAWA